jgi:tRNA1Val (adenine37-N6)-methyltransferase
MITTETLFQGGLRVRQKKQGYRFSIDAGILANHVSLREGSVGVDLGTGCGIIPLILAHRFPSAQIYGIEIQKDLADLAKTNVRLNHMEDRITILHGDIKDFKSLLEPGVADMGFSNPPYRKLHSGRLSPDRERAVARHEIKASLSDVMFVAEGLLKPSGRVVIIYSAERVADLIAQMRAFRLEPKRLRLVHSKQDSEAELILVEGLKHGQHGVKVAPPLVVHNADGSFTDEVQNMIAGMK